MQFLRYPGPSYNNPKDPVHVLQANRVKLLPEKQVKNTTLASLTDLLHIWSLAENGSEGFYPSGV